MMQDAYVRCECSVVTVFGGQEGHGSNHFNFRSLCMISISAFPHLTQ